MKSHDLKERLKKEKNDEYIFSIHLHANIQRFHVLLMQYLI